MLATLLTGPLAVAAPAVPRAEEAFGSVEKTYVVKTRHGSLYVEVVHPTRGGAVVRAPAIVTYSPYHGAFGRNGDASRWVPRGYARVAADLVGTGNSGGCYDYGGNREKQTGYDLIEWIAAQPWSTGRTAMIGSSYDGTTAIATATQRPPHLTTIVPEAAISRWYEYAYSGGMRYVVNNEKLGRQGPTNGLVIDEQGFDTPIGFDLGFGGLPPTDVTGEGWAERAASAMTPCDEVEHIRGGYSLTPDYGHFWNERDYVREAHKIDIPVLVSHNWGDWNVKQEEAWKLWRALSRSPQRLLYMGTRWDNHGTPGGEYRATVDAWMDRWLKGARNGVEGLPPVISQTSDSSGPGEFLAGAPTVTPITLHATEQFELAVSPTARPGRLSPAVPITGQNTESRAAAAPRPGVASDFLYFESPPLSQDLRVFGEIRILLTTVTGREWLTLTPSVLDIDPEARDDEGRADDPSAAVAVTRGWLDTRYAKTLRLQHRQPANRPVLNQVVAKPQDYVFRSGHRIGLVVQTDMLEWVMPKAYDSACAGCAVYSVDFSGTRIVLPGVGVLKAGRLFS